MELTFTNLLIIVAIGFAATAVGLALEVVTPANAAALIAAGLLAVVIFPAVSLILLRRDPKCSRAIDASMAARRAAMAGTMQPGGDDRVVAAPGA